MRRLLKCSAHEILMFIRIKLNLASRTACTHEKATDAIRFSEEFIFFFFRFCEIIDFARHRRSILHFSMLNLAFLREFCE